MSRPLTGGLVHDMPADLASALTEADGVAGLWENLTPIGRNEFVCWVENAKREATRAEQTST